MANIHLSYNQFKAIFGDLGGFEYTMYNWSSGGKCNAIANIVKEAGYDVNARVSDELYNHMTETINLWDEETESGQYLMSNGQPSPDANRIRSKNPIEIKPNTTYCFTGDNFYDICWYDEEDNFISYSTPTISNPTRTSPSNAKYLRFTLSTTYGTTYNNDICINVSNEYINGNYFPYFTGQKFLVLVGEYTFTGNETYLDRGTNQIGNQIYVVDTALFMNYKYGINDNVVANKGTFLGTTESTTNVQNGSDPKGFRLYEQSGNPNSKYIYFIGYTLQEIVGFKIDYQMATPVLVDLD